MGVLHIRGLDLCSEPVLQATPPPPRSPKVGCAGILTLLCLIASLQTINPLRADPL